MDIWMDGHTFCPQKSVHHGTMDRPRHQPTNGSMDKHNICKQSRVHANTNLPEFSILTLVIVFRPVRFFQIDVSSCVLSNLERIFHGPAFWCLRCCIFIEKSLLMSNQLFSKKACNCSFVYRYGNLMYSPRSSAQILASHESIFLFE